MNSGLTLRIVKCGRWSGWDFVQGIHNRAENKATILKINFAEGCHGGGALLLTKIITPLGVNIDFFPMKWPKDCTSMTILGDLAPKSVGTFSLMATSSVLLCAQ